jgi:hypothetical protein
VVEAVVVVVMVMVAARLGVYGMTVAVMSTYFYSE